ncbi:looped-hinge helix DNA binding domain-containing protein, AbrB family [Granulicella rosea]|uniref:Looped-hinge helix DNA binding domain-containing protein, AbrB family n=1 Tax=Granulicella rosea TaxID=474952 RepID=A0A239DYP9_9BACT|nr:AbrB/MazE/SpoVT family DNA-binding domain-containing protein [Granulicella rosea]SNS37487.1 looped-hinge helix DNA binding domain-containing protein, AbrB family [Granulicella rosea]
MSVEKAQVSANGRIVIPATYRRAMGLKGGEILTMSLDDEGLHIQTMRQALLKSQAIVRKYVDPSRSLSDELIAERRLEFQREQERG